MDPELKTILCVFAFGLGASIASFLNVVAWRVDRPPAVALPEVQRADQVVAEHPHPLLARAARQVR